METITNVLNSFWLPVYNFLPKLPTLILIVLLGYLIIQIIYWILNRALKLSKIPRALIGVIASLSLIIMWVILFAEIARQLGMGSLAVTISGSLAVLALALASGASGLAGDIIAGVFLARDSDFEIGFRIRIGGIEGIIQKIDIRKIRVVDDKGDIHIFPNTKLDKEGWVIVSQNVEDNKDDLKKIIAKNEDKQK
ncbi:MAG TPA: mechanosensitive ion channel [bacterium]|jgi:small-conductance mechanosensitive channel|nr:mechanosensitive ion channel [bacterium]